MKYLTVSLIPWKWDGCCVVGGTPLEFQEWAKRFCGAEITTGNNSTGHAWVAYGQPWILWVETLTNTPALAHEALHVTSGVLQARGLKHTDESEEAYTYTMEHIIREALQVRHYRRIRS